MAEDLTIRRSLIYRYTLIFTSSVKVDEEWNTWNNQLELITRKNIYKHMSDLLI